MLKKNVNLYIYVIYTLATNVVVLMTKIIVISL